MPQGSGKTTKKVVKWCVRELPGYSGCDKFFFLFFWSMLFLCEMEIRLMPNWPSEWFWLKLNDFKVESHCSLRRINETCSSTHKRLPPSLPVVVGVDTDTPHLRQQWTTTALYNRVWKPWYLFCIIEKILAKFGILCTNAYLYEGDGVAIFSFCRDAWDQLLRSEIYAFCRCGWVEAKKLVPSQKNSR